LEGVDPASNRTAKRDSDQSHLGGLMFAVWGSSRKEKSASFRLALSSIIIDFFSYSGTSNSLTKLSRYENRQAKQPFVSASWFAS
jgi:hypothetical protein